MCCRPLLLGLALAVLCLPGCSGEPTPAPPSEPAGTAAVASSPVGANGVADDDAMPRLVLGLLDGSSFDLSAQRGGWVVVNFWATWCAPCLKEIPDLSALHEDRDDLMVIGLAYEDIEVEAMRAFLERVPAAYPIAILDPYSDAPAGDFDTPRGLPMTYLIAPDGRIAHRFLGPVTSADINETIAAHPAG